MDVGKTRPGRGVKEEQVVVDLRGRNVGTSVKGLDNSNGAGKDKKDVGWEVAKGLEDVIGKTFGKWPRNPHLYDGRSARKEDLRKLNANLKLWTSKVNDEALWGKKPTHTNPKCRIQLYSGMLFSEELGIGRGVLLKQLRPVVAKKVARKLHKSHFH